MLDTPLEDYLKSQSSQREKLAQGKKGKSIVFNDKYEINCYLCNVRNKRKPSDIESKDSDFSEKYNKIKESILRENSESVRSLTKTNSPALSPKFSRNKSKSKVIFNKNFNSKNNAYQFTKEKDDQRVTSSIICLIFINIY